MEVVGEFDGGAAVDIVEFADQAERIEAGISQRVTIAKIIGEQSAPASAEADAAAGEPFFFVEEIGGLAEIGRLRAVLERAGKVGVELEDGVSIERVGGDEEFLAGIAAAGFEPGDVLVTGEEGILAVGALAGPVGDPVGSILEELGRAEGVRKDDEELTVIGLLPEFEEAVLGGFQLFVVVGKGGEGHGEFVGVGADGFEVVLVGEIGVGSAFEDGTDDVGHGFDDVFLPEEAVAAAGAKIADAEVGSAAEAGHFFPEASLGARIEDVEFEFAEAFEGGAGFEFADGGESVDLPHGGFGPKTVKGKGELAAVSGELVVGEAKVLFEPSEEFRFEDVLAAVEGVSSEPDEFGFVEAALAGLLELGAKFFDGDQVGEANVEGAVDEGEGGAGFGEVFPDELEH